MAGRSDEIAALFDRNAGRYDMVNSVLTFGLDACWRKATASRAVRLASDVAGSASPRVLDACGGTGLVALELARRGACVTLADVSGGMLAIAERRARASGISVRIVRADLANEPASTLPGAPFAAATMAFGLRYVDDPVALLRTLASALMPGAALVVLEAVVPSRRLLSGAAGLYFFHAAPRIATALAGRDELSRELTATVRRLGTLAELLTLVAAADLRPLEVRSFAQGTVVGLVLAARSCPRNDAAGALPALPSSATLSVVEHPARALPS